MITDQNDQVLRAFAHELRAIAHSERTWKEVCQKGYKTLFRCPVHLHLVGGSKIPSFGEMVEKRQQSEVICKK